jgi:transposase
VPELDAEVAFEVGLLLNQYDLLEDQIETADRHVASLLDGELARRLQTIPGVGPSITATLIAEIGEITRFSDFDQLQPTLASTRLSAAQDARARTPRPPGT